MANDLISRSALIEDIKRSAEKDANGIVLEAYQLAHKHIIEIVELQPTAFNVEKVVEVLEAERDRTYFVETARPQNQNAHGTSERYIFDKAIDVVRKGGVSND